jgi:periodic tryptophan protein 2
VPLIQRVFEKIPSGDIKLIVRELPDVYLARLMRFVAKRAEEGPHLEFCLRWIEAVFVAKGRLLRDRKGEYASEIRALMRVLGTIEREVRRLGENNGYKLDVLLRQPLKSRENGFTLMDIDHAAVGDAMNGGAGDEDDEGEWMGVD